jgi:hypothetical protein
VGRGSGGEEEGGCLYVESEFCENSLAEICCVERDTETHKQRRAVGGGGGAIKLQNLVVKKKERRTKFGNRIEEAEEALE